MNEWRLRTRYPISSNCPLCGSTSCRQVKAETVMAFANDRVCRDCARRYTPPTPAWARVLFLVVGLGIVAASVLLAGWILASDRPSLKGCVMCVMGGVIGLACLYKAAAAR
jgi:hypothetical protein